MTPDADQAFLPFPARVWRTPEQDRWRASDSDSGSESREGAKCRVRAASPDLSGTWVDNLIWGSALLCSVGHDSGWCFWSLLYVLPTKMPTGSTGAM